MIELLVFGGFIVACMAVAEVLGFVFFLFKLVLWAVLLPFRILFKILMIPVWLTLGALGLAAGVIAVPLLLIVVAGVVIVGLLAALAAVLLPAIPFVLLGLLLWAIFSRRPVVA